METKQLFQPKHENLRRHIAYYWQVDSTNHLFHQNTTILGYPGITPELIIPLSGKLCYHYAGKFYQTNRSIISTVVAQNVILDFQDLHAFILVRFKTNALASLIPFVDPSVEELMRQGLFAARKIFGESIDRLEQELKRIPSDQRAAVLNEWFLAKWNPSREGFIVDLLNKEDRLLSLQEIMDLTNYSYSTVERIFKKETGLTPKRYLVYKRFKSCLEDILRSKSSNWSGYISTYDYYDQSHFIKELKKYTRFTPSQLLARPSLAAYRP